MATAPSNDPFVDDMTALDLRPDSQAMLESLAEIANEEENAPVLRTAADPDPAPPAPGPQGPQVHTFEDGSSVAIEKTDRGFKATLDSNTGAPAEVFYGSDEGEMWRNVAAGKINATKKIRQLNRQVKLAKNAPGDPAPAAPQPTAPRIRPLTADDLIELQTQLAANPDLALETWFQKKTGLSVEELVSLAREGREAKQVIADKDAAEAIGEIATEFVSGTPDYFADPRNQNVSNLVAWLAKHKLGQARITDLEATMLELYRGGFWTVDSLSDAYEDLSESGLLLARPAAPRAEVPADPAPAPAPPAVAAPAPQDERIARTERRPRAGLGIRTRETSADVPPVTEKPPSAEAFDDMSTEDVNQLFSDIQRVRRGQQTRRP